MSTQKTDIIAIGSALGQLDPTFIDTLRQVGKAPLGWHHDFTARFYIPWDSEEKLPMAVVMCQEENYHGWRDTCEQGTLVLISPHLADQAVIDEIRSRGGILVLARNHPALTTLLEGDGLITYSNADDLIKLLAELIASPERRQQLGERGRRRFLEEKAQRAQGNARIKVLHVVQSISLGGAVRALLGLVPYLGDRYSHTILSLAPEQVDPTAVQLASSMGVGHCVAQSISDAARYIESSDLVHVHWWNNPQMNELLSSDLPPCRMIGWFHVGGHEAPQVASAEAVDFFDISVPCSPFTAEAPAFAQLDGATRERKCAMIYGATDFGRLAGVERRPHAGFNVGYIGTVDFLKMHPDYFEMSAGVKIPDVKFVVCGSGRAEEVLRRQAIAAKMTDRFDIRGYMHDIRPALEIFDVYGYPLCPETYAAAELNLQEAMFVGIPPVVFPYGGLKRLVVNDFTGFIVNSAAEYRQAIEHLYYNPEDRLRIGRNAAEYARQIFGSENAARKFKPLYERLLEQPKSSRRWNKDAVVSLTRRLQAGSVPLDKTKGTTAFVASLGKAGTIFERSLFPVTSEEAIKAETEIMGCSELMRSSGIMQYARYYPKEPHLQLWAGLAMLSQGKGTEAMLHLSEAFNHGLNDWRVIVYLARATAATGNRALAEQLLGKAREMSPSAPLAL